jgi:glycosyltransferase involved in cell wall biosynthesis
MQAPLPFLVYRDRIGVRSEIGFLRRQYIGFTRLHPVWIGRTVLGDADEVGSDVIRLGGRGPLGGLRRLGFRYAGYAPPVGVENPAVLHAQFARGGALALPLARALGLRMVVTLHGGDVSKRKNWRGTVLARRWPALVRETARFVCVSGAVAEVAAARGVPADKLVVLPIGVEMPARAPSGPRPEGYLFVGRFVEKKGILVLAEAVRRLRAGGDATPLVCVGDGPLRPALEALAREMTGVTLTGWLAPERVRERMAASVALLVPSVVAADGDAEGLPSVIPEAMARACAVVGADQGGIAEAIRHNRTGLLVRPGDASALAEAMLRIGREAGLRERLGAGGFAYAATAFDARMQSASLEAILLSARE